MPARLPGYCSPGAPGTPRRWKRSRRWSMTNSAGWLGLICGARRETILWFANIRFSGNGLTFIAFQSKNRGSMPTLILFLFRCARLLFSGHAAVAVENAALRLQLAAFQRQPRRPVLTSLDRLFWVGLSLLWKPWRSPLIYVRADTVVRWRRERFSQVLGTSSQEEPTTSRQTRDGSRDSTSD